MSNGMIRQQWNGLAQAQQVAAGQRFAGMMAGMAGQSGACPTAAPASSPYVNNVNLNPFSCQGTMAREDPGPVLGCNVLGANTLNQAFGGIGTGLGVGPGAQALLSIDAGDSCRYRPRSLLLVGYLADAVANLIAAPVTQVPLLLTNAFVGNVGVIRRGGLPQFGIISDGFSDRKELTCVDWTPFTSVNNQGLNLTLQSIFGANTHFFLDLWGDNLS